MKDLVDVKNHIQTLDFQFEDKYKQAFRVNDPWAVKKEEPIKEMKQFLKVCWPE